MRFTRHRGTVRADVDAVETMVLGQLTDQLLELVAAPAVGEDPLAAMVGLPADDVFPPDDPVLARLLPAAYADDDTASADFRRYTDADLRMRKRANATAVRASLPEGKGRVELDRDQVDQWLECLNDMRLALGTALGVTEDTHPEDHAADDSADDPAREALEVYGWLGWLQESLLSCVEPRTGGN